VEHAKPAPDLLLNAAAQLGIRPAGVWYVGDSTWDMQAAVAARMVAVGVATGATTSSDLRSAGAVVALATLSALPGYLLPALGRPADAIVTR
jgi:phosphoglycolate phosphatase-like HAD superfamily hydrolase